MSKTIIIPTSLCEIKYNSLWFPENSMSGNNFKSSKDFQLSLFTNVNNTYLLDLQTLKKHYKTVKTHTCFFKKLNVKGELSINSSNINYFTIEINPHYGQNFDALDCRKLNIESTNYVNLSIRKDMKDKTSTGFFAGHALKEIKINAKLENLIIDELDNLEQIKIIDENKNININPKKTNFKRSLMECKLFCWNFFKVTNCPKLNLIDLSELKDINCEVFQLQNIDPNCVLKFKKDFMINIYSIFKSLPQIEADEFYPGLDGNFAPFNRSWKLFRFINNKYIKGNIIELTYSQFQDEIRYFFDHYNDFVDALPSSENRIL